MNAPNQQTPGPAKATRSHEDFDGPLFDLEAGETRPFTGIRTGAKTLLCAHDLATMTEADARLLASAYTAFDRAGRELGIDAAELAERVDLAEVIRCAFDFATLADKPAGWPGVNDPRTDFSARLLRENFARLFAAKR